MLGAWVVVVMLAAAGEECAVRCAARRVMSCADHDGEPELCAASYSTQLYFRARPCVVDDLECVLGDAPCDAGCGHSLVGTLHKRSPRLGLCGVCDPYATNSSARGCVDDSDCRHQCGCERLYGLPGGVCRPQRRICFATGCHDFDRPWRMCECQK